MYQILSIIPRLLVIKRRRTAGDLISIDTEESFFN